MITANFTDDTFNMMIIYMLEFTTQMFSYPETQSRRQAEGIINCADNNPRLMVKEDQYCKKKMSWMLTGFGLGQSKPILH